MQETKKSFRNIFKKEDLQAAISAACNLKGVGPAMASGEDTKKRKQQQPRGRVQTKSRRGNPKHLQKCLLL